MIKCFVDVIKENLSWFSGNKKVFSSLSDGSQAWKTSMCWWRAHIHQSWNGWDSNLLLHEFAEPWGIWGCRCCRCQTKISAKNEKKKSIRREWHFVLLMGLVLTLVDMIAFWLEYSRNQMGTNLGTDISCEPPYNVGNKIHPWKYDRFQSSWHFVWRNRESLEKIF